MTETTHSSGGAGHPHLIIAASAPPIGLPPDSPDRRLPLRPDVTTIGSSRDCDIVLPDLQPLHARVVRDAFDEFRAFDESGGGTTVEGFAAGGRALHTGDRLLVGPWILLYGRDEFADHGRPHGGRQGGELSDQEPQPPPEPDPTAPLQPRSAPGPSGP